MNRWKKGEGDEELSEVECYQVGREGASADCDGKELGGDEVKDWAPRQAVATHAKGAASKECNRVVTATALILGREGDAEDQEAHRDDGISRV